MMNRYWRTRFNGPIASYADDLRAAFSALAYAPSTLASHLGLWAQLDRWLADRGLGTSELTTVRIEEFLAERSQTHRYLYTVKALSPGLEFLRRAGAVPEVQAMAESEVETIERQFRSYLLIERGLAEISAATYVVRVRPFLADRARRGRLDLKSLTAADVSDFVSGWLPGLSKAPAKSTVTALRSLLSFLHVSGVVAKPLASVVPTVASWKLAGLPIGLTPAQVQSLLGACDQTTTVGRRDLAILTLLARLGLRAGEVAGLTLDDIDWRVGTVTVHGKGNSDEQLPLSVDVGSALSRYLENGRPPSASGRMLFIRARAPYQGLNRKSISTMVGRAASRAGIGTVHAHLLRHTLASDVLSQGASLDEVGQLLRHRSRASTTIYAKVDQQRLLQLARPWPTSGRSAMSLLREQVATYLRLRRSLGYKLVEHERFLNQFLDYLEKSQITTITAANALAWAKLPVGVNPRWHGARLSAVRGFAAWAQAFDPDIQVPPVGLLPMRSVRATPYLYSDEQICALMNVAAALTPPVRAATFQTLIGLLAVTGMRAGEATRADITDLDLDTGSLTVRSTKFGKTRLLPLHTTVVDELKDYLALRSAAALPGTTALLISVAGTRLTYDNAQRVFKKLTARAGIMPRSNACRLRMHDLRHSFAVSTLLDAYRAGVDVGERLPLLSTYLGHTEPANTYWYLHAAPELLALAAQRLDTHVTEDNS